MGFGSVILYHVSLILALRLIFKLVFANKERKEMASQEKIVTVAEKAPVTAKRKVRDDLETTLFKPCNRLYLLHYMFFLPFLSWIFYICNIRFMMHSIRIGQETRR